MSNPHLCEVCGEPTPEGEEMFRFHGYSGPCPKPPLPRKPTPVEALLEAARDLVASRSDTFKAGNNKRVGIQDESGEKMWIVPFDEMAALEDAVRALATHSVDEER